MLKGYVAMAMRIINMTIPEPLLAQVDEAAMAEGLNRSQLLREAVGLYLDSRGGKKTSDGLLRRLAALATKGPNVSAVDLDRRLYRRGRGR